MSDSVVAPDDTYLLKNIFKLPEYEILEDRYTAAWGYVLRREPSLAQAVADIILRDRGMTAKVIAVSDHPKPKCDTLKRPDFLISCEGLDIFVEHKLDALLHHEQLESYLDFQLPATYVALIAPSFQPVPKAVLDDERYLKPSGKDHFRWSDFYPSVKSQPGWLAQEFAEYMVSLGMAPFTLKGAEDIFDLSVKPVQFEDAMISAANQIFPKDNSGSFIKKTSTGRGLEVRTPHPSLTLLYMWAEQRSTHVRDFVGPVLALEVYEREIEAPCSLENAVIKTPSGVVIRRHKLSKPRKQGEGKCRVTYVAPLVEMIQHTREATVIRMVEMLQLVRADFWTKD